MFGKDTAKVPSDVADEVILEGPIRLDLAEVRDEPVAAREWHTVRIERADAGLSTQKRLPKIFILARVTDQASPEHNRTIIWNCMLRGDGLPFTKRCFAALGMPEQLNYPTYQDLANDLIDREVEVKGKHRQYEGETQFQANAWRPVTPDISF